MCDCEQDKTYQKVTAWYDALHAFSKSGKYTERHYDNVKHLSRFGDLKSCWDMIEELCRLESDYIVLSQCGYCDVLERREQYNFHNLACEYECSWCRQMIDCDYCDLDRRDGRCDEHNRWPVYYGKQECYCVNQRYVSDKVFLRVVSNYLPTLKRNGWVFIWSRIQNGNCSNCTTPHLVIRAPPDDETLDRAETLAIEHETKLFLRA